MALPVKMLMSMLVSSAVTSEGAEFLGGQRVAKDMVEQMLAFELPSSTTRDRLAALEEQFRSTFAALPKNEHGRLEPSTVRYALHRYFAQHYGWSVKGLDPEGAGWNASSSASLTSGDVLKSLAPFHIQELFAKRVQGRGLTLEDLAVFAATMSDLIFQESLGVLQSVYDKLGLPVVKHLPEEDFDLAIRAFLSDLITGEFGQFTSRDNFPKLEAQAKDFYPEYDDILMWARDLFHTQEFLRAPRRNPFKASLEVSFDRAAEFLRDFVQNFGMLLEDECSTLKEDLVDMEQAGSGRVLLSRFYANNKMSIHDSVDYIRNQGALEDMTGAPRVVIPNFVLGPSRCMPLSSYYSVCCRDECGHLLGQVEREIAQPSAPPARIAEIVSGLPSKTTDAPRNLSSVLMARLDEIASLHAGHVPLHGRLFMQWMHHAYPRECSYPHEAGTTKPVTQDEWLSQNGHLHDVLVSRDEKAKFSVVDGTEFVDPSDLPWTAVEELVGRHANPEAQSKTEGLRILVCIVALLSLAVPMIRISAALLTSSRDHKPERVMV